ncbi:hypothetical protein [Agrobacterium sp. NPDC089420]|uniref:hypothetical protein n=1 Tax=Agrobacterium sp. NPDC089420 TaxID=3363918 RepID=UPI00384D63E6
MRKGLVGAATALMLLAGAAVTASAELTLNYVDPEGVGLAFALLREPAAVSWLGNAMSLHADTRLEQPSLPRCRALPDQPLPCRISDTTAGILATLSQRDLSAELGALLVSNGLVMDVAAPRTVLVGTDPAGRIRNIDFVGLVRGINEQLPAPDAVSVFIVRVSSEATLSIVERNRDATVDIDQITFSSEK